MNAMAAVNAITHHLERDSYTHEARRAIAAQFGLSDMMLRDCEGRARAALGMQRPKTPRELEEQFAQWLTELESMRKEAMEHRGPKDKAPNLTAAVRCHQLKGMALGYLGAERKGEAAKPAGTEPTEDDWRTALEHCPPKLLREALERMRKEAH